MQRLDKAKDLLKEHGNYDWLTETGNLVVSNGGIEWAATYFVMLLALLFSGAGKLSLDHLLAVKFRQ
jgi:putative oxidoreductase